MYIIEISDTQGQEVWFEGKGWYWTDQFFMMNGPYLSEYGAVYDYAWYINAVIAEVNERRSKH